METNSIWQLLSGFTVGSVIAWIIVIGTIITVLCAGTIKLFKFFTKINELKEKNEAQRERIEQHDETLKNIQETLNQMMKVLNDQNEINFDQMKYTISHGCTVALAKGEISAECYKSLEEMFDKYKRVFNGDGYVENIMKKMRKEVKIIGEIE